MSSSEKSSEKSSSEEEPPPDSSASRKWTREQLEDLDPSKELSKALNRYGAACITQRRLARVFATAEADRPMAVFTAIGNGQT